MKRILFILFVLTSFTASAQWTIINGNQRFAKGLGIPTKDTFNTYTLADTSQIVLRPQDSALYVHYKGRWQKIGGGGTGGVGTLQQVTDLGNTTTKAIKINSNINNGVGVAEKFILKDNNATNTDSVYITMNTGLLYNGYNNTDITMNNGILSAQMILNGEDGEIYISDNANQTLSELNQSGVRIISPNYNTVLLKDKLSFIYGDILNPVNCNGIDITPIYPTVDNYRDHPHKIYTPLTVTGIYNDTLATLRNVRAGGGSSTDTTSLSNRINLKLNTSDSSIYQTKYRSDTARINTYTAINDKLNTSDTLSLSNRINLKLNKSDSTIYFTKYRSDTSRTNIYSAINGKLNTNDTLSLSNRINTKLNTSDTANMLLPYLRKIDTTSMLSKYVNLANYGLTKTNQTLSVDTSKISTLYQTNLKVNISDTANMLTPYLRKIDTANLQRKSLAAYSFQANNTNATATTTANTFKDTSGTYTGTPTWTGGTAPTSITNAVFYYTQVGKQVTLRITMIYTNTGATNTRVQIPLTSNIPTPATPSGYSSTSDIINFGSGFFGNSTTTYVTSSAGNALTFLRGTATGAEIVIDRGTAGAGKYVWATISYFTN